MRAFSFHTTTVAAMPVLGCLLLLFAATDLHAQACRALGQTPATAFPVCGTSVFAQSTVPVCAHGDVPVPCTSDDIPYQDKNPFWYKFTCFTAGTIGFLITPNNPGDDYDWQLFDVTGHDPDDVYTDASLRVSCNWSGEPGQTGSSPAGRALEVCGGLKQPLFSKMASLKQGHNYLLLISHFTDSQTGYKLSFEGGTAGITDTTPPRLKSATAACDGTKVTVKLNKKMRCESLAPDGSDFILQGGAAAVTGAAGNLCSSGFDMDAVTLQLSRGLPPGTYSLSVKNGTDGNTLLDNCGTGIPEGDQVSFEILPVQPTPMDSLVPPVCASDRLELVFPKPVRCSSVAPDGSDFVVAGLPAVTVAAASGDCDENGLSRVIHIKLSAPMVHQGAYSLRLTRGSDGNTVIDACGQETPAGSALAFAVRDTVSAAFSFKLQYPCGYCSVDFDHAGGHGIDRWQWSFDNGALSGLQRPLVIDSSYSPLHAQLIVSNGFCSDTAAATIIPEKAFELKAAFEAPEFLCPQDKALFLDHSVGDIHSWKWNFGNGVTSNSFSPPLQVYPVTAAAEHTYPVMLIVDNGRGCADTALHEIRVLNNCYIAVPSAFTPNGDGLNDYLYPLNAYKADKLEFRVYDRWGKLVFETNDWRRRWDGRCGGEAQNTGTFIWMLQYVDRDTGAKIFKKGTTVLIR